MFFRKTHAFSCWPCAPGRRSPAVAALAAAMAGRGAVCRNLLRFWLADERLEEGTRLVLALAVALADAGISLGMDDAPRLLRALDCHSLIENAPRVTPPRVAPARALA